MTKRAAIILSGGKAERFQRKQKKWQDKALVEIFGKPLLIHAVDKVQDLTEEIVIIVNDEIRKAQYSKVLAEHGIENVKLSIDEKIDHLGGPIVAIFSGLRSVEADYCLTLPCDMPFLQPKVIEYMFSKATDSRVVVPMWPNGRLETLLMVLERKSVLEIVNTLCSLMRPRSDDIMRGALDVLFVSIMGQINVLDPELKSFVNINAPEDISKLEPRRVQGSFTEDMRLNLGSLPVSVLQGLRDTVILRKSGKFLRASGIFSICAAQLENENSFFWAALSRENEGKSLLEWIQQRNKPNFNFGQISRFNRALQRAACNYELEAKLHEKNRIIFLAERARSDKSWCESRRIKTL